MSHPWLPVSFYKKTIICKSCFIFARAYRQFVWVQFLKKSMSIIYLKFNQSCIKCDWHEYWLYLAMMTCLKEVILSLGSLTYKMDAWICLNLGRTMWQWNPLLYKAWAKCMWKSYVRVLLENPLWKGVILLSVFHSIQERRKLKAMFPTNSFRDEEECQINLRCFQQFVLTGNLPSRSDDLYPLPHRAYEGQARREAYNQNVPGQVQSNVSSVSKGKKSGCHRHHHHHHHHKKRQHDLSKAVELDASICMSITILACPQPWQISAQCGLVIPAVFCNPPYSVLNCLVPFSPTPYL